MAKSMPERKLQAVEALVAAHPDGVGIQEIRDGLEEEKAWRTLQYRLKRLVDKGRPIRKARGAGQNTGYRMLRNGLRPELHLKKNRR